MPPLLYKKRRMMSGRSHSQSRSLRTINRRRANAMDVLSYPSMNLSASDPKIFKISIRVTNLVSSNGAGSLAQIINTNDPSACSDWSPLSSFYDQFQVLEVWMNFYPSFSSVVQATSTAFAPIHVCYDADSTAAVASVDAAVQYGNRKSFNLFKPFRYGIKNVVQTDNSVDNAGMACQYRPGYGMALDCANVDKYKKGVITWYADNLPVSTDFGDVVIDYFVRFFERR